ncbi:MAG: 16S rRNA (guanine(966)-N(2))-methyltransferase RsmD [Caldiserica bacterium]|nr:16S rRNA (guanine(966)-N(2))-methyltransferase RsmD [Caldisericota bacterium]
MATTRQLKPRRKVIVRPITSRVKNAIFSILGERIEGKAILDLFAGLGSLGMEALNRGAEEAVFVEVDAGYAERIKDALQKYGFNHKGKVIKGDARRWVEILAGKGEQFDIVFLDPPYGSGLGREILQNKKFPALLSENALVILREFWREAETEISNSWQVKEKRKYGEMVITFITLP